MQARQDYRIPPLAAKEPYLGEPDTFMINEIPYITKINIRGNTEDQQWMKTVKDCIGLEVPTVPNQLVRSEDLAIFWLGPNEWLITAPPGEASRLASPLEEAFIELRSQGSHCAIVDVTESRTVLKVSGKRVTQVLNKGCPLDFREKSFPQDTVAQSYLGHAFVLFHRLPHGDEHPEFDLYVLNSFASYVWDYLTDAALEWT